MLKYPFHVLFLVIDMDNVVKTTQEIMDLFNDHAEIAGELSNDLNIILVYGAPVDNLINYLQNSGFKHINGHVELKYGLISDNEYMASYIIHEKWAKNNVTIEFEYWLDVENDRIETKLEIISVYRA